jgi:hypothetical protein
LPIVRCWDSCSKILGEISLHSSRKSIGKSTIRKQKPCIAICLPECPRSDCRDILPRYAVSENRLLIHDYLIAVRVPVQNEQLDVPSTILSAIEVTFSTDLDNSHINATISAASFKNVSLWMLYIADKSYRVDHDYAVPKRANIRRSCIISFGPNNGDGWFAFSRNCCTDRK